MQRKELFEWKEVKSEGGDSNPRIIGLQPIALGRLATLALYHVSTPSFLCVAYLAAPISRCVDAHTQHVYKYLFAICRVEELRQC